MARSLTSGNAVNDASQYTTSQFQPTASALVLVFVANVRSVLSPLGTLQTPSASGCGLTWEVVNSVETTNGDRRLTCFRARGAAPTRDALVFDFADQIQDICAWSVMEYDDVDATGANGSGAVSQNLVSNGSGGALTELSVSFTPGDAAKDRFVGAIILQTTAGQPSAVTAGSGFAEIHQQLPNQALKDLTFQTQDALPGPTSIRWSWTGSQRAAAIVVGVKAKPPAPTGPGPTTTDPTAALAARFEPVLHLHPQESFFPIDAKRYVHNAALWGARPAFDDKNSWGTAPLVAAKKLSTVPGAPDYLGKPDLILDTATNERFLELGGWKDRSGNHESGVSSSSVNQYADRGDIKRVVDTDLSAAKFWYHAELFDTTRLRKLAGEVKAPDLAKTIAGFTNPTLLCYYLFYPAHEQGVDESGCVGAIGAKELACHAGDWQCFALLLEGDGSGKPEGYTPRFFGITGSRPAPVMVGGAETFRPYSFDDEGRVTMKVEAWRTGSDDTPVQPDLVGTHPRFYVARGSHSMYTSVGAQDVSPYVDANTSGGCGRFDTPSVIPPARNTPGEYDPATAWEIAIVKTVSGGLLGSIFWGVVAGLIEFVSSATGAFGEETPAPGLDRPNADAAPTTAAQSITVRPADLVIDGVTSGQQNWFNRFNAVSPPTPTSEYVVNRSTQIWWPSDDRKSGFRGRWGQRVASDPVLHRAGVKFPDFWEMFLYALEDGFGSGDLTRP